MFEIIARCGVAMAGSISDVIPAGNEAFYSFDSAIARSQPVS